MRSPDSFSVMDDDVAQLQAELVLVKARLKALREFIAEARSHEDNLFSWIAHRELNHDLPGSDVGLTIGLNGEVSFKD